MQTKLTHHNVRHWCVKFGHVVLQKQLGKVNMWLHPVVKRGIVILSVRCLECVVSIDILIFERSRCVLFGPVVSLSMDFMVFGSFWYSFRISCSTNGRIFGTRTLFRAIPKTIHLFSLSKTFIIAFQRWGCQQIKAKKPSSKRKKR